MQEANVTVITHSDLDGLCAAGCVKEIYPQARVMITNYGRRRSLFKIQPGSLVFITDFTLDLDEYLRLEQKGIRIIWIDHHKFNYEQIESKFRNDGNRTWQTCEGIRRDDYCGAALTWMYLHPNVPPDAMPPVVKLVNDYDLWKFEDPRTRDLSFGAGLWDIRPGNPGGDLFWRELLACNPDRMKTVLKYGAHVRKYVEMFQDTLCEDLAYYTTLPTPMGQKHILAMGIRNGNSSVFERMDKSNVDALFLGQYVSNIKAFKCSMYTPDNVKEILPIVSMFEGGGGHPGAGGFQSEKYPLPLPTVRTPRPMLEALESYKKLADVRDSSVIISQWAARNSSITMRSQYFHVKDYCGLPVIGINCAFFPDMLAVRLSSTDAINFETNEVAKAYLGFVLTNTGWFRCSLYPTDTSTTLDDLKTALLRYCPEAQKTLTEWGNGLWWYQRDMPVQPPIAPKQDIGKRL